MNHTLSQAFTKALGQAVKFTARREETHSNLNFVEVAVHQGTATVTGTNGHILFSEVVAAAGWPDGTGYVERQDVKGLMEAVKDGEEVTVTVTFPTGAEAAGVLTLLKSEVQVEIAISQVKFPNWTALVNNADATLLSPVFDRKGLLSLVKGPKRAMLKSLTLDFRVEAGQVAKRSCDGFAIGGVSGRLAETCDLSRIKRQVYRVGFNPTYFILALEACEQPTVKLHLGKVHEVAAIREGQRLVMIMPVRLDAGDKLPEGE